MALIRERAGRKSFGMQIVTADSLDVSDEFLARISLWTSFYRKYPFIFAEHFLGVKLETFQKILLYEMFNSQNFQFIASRGLGKSWLTALFIICRAILYPNSKIVISAGNRRQALEIINYIKAFRDESECLAKCIRNLNDSLADPKVEFFGGSTVVTAVANNNSRGKRCHVLIEYV